MNSKEKADDFYERFQKQLEESQNWPGLYMFKFIVKSNSLQIDKLKDQRDNVIDEYGIGDIGRGSGGEE